MICILGLENLADLASYPTNYSWSACRCLKIWVMLRFMSQEVVCLHEGAGKLVDLASYPTFSDWFAGRGSFYMADQAFSHIQVAIVCIFVRENIAHMPCYLTVITPISWSAFRGWKPCLVWPFTALQVADLYFGPEYLANIKLMSSLHVAHLPFRSGNLWLIWRHNALAVADRHFDAGKPGWSGLIPHYK